MSENPYQSPSGESPLKRHLQIRFLPAALFFIFGLLLAVGNAGLIALAFFVEDQTLHRASTGRIVFVFAGGSWIAAGRYWNKGAWMRASLWSIVGYVAGVVAANLTRLGMPQ